MNNKEKKKESFARELALLALANLSETQKKLAQEQPDEFQENIDELVFELIATILEETQAAIEAAAAELQRSNERLLNSQTRTSEVEGARLMTAEAIELTNTAINRLGEATKMAEKINECNRKDVRDYARTLLFKVAHNAPDIDAILGKSIQDWKLTRLPKLDRDILRIAVAEIVYLSLTKSIAINEAVELAKEYSDEQGSRFINGLLRRVTERLKLGV
jgi:transcription antitermination protein NusB